MYFMTKKTPTTWGRACKTHTVDVMLLAGCDAPDTPVAPLRFVLYPLLC